MKCIVTTFPVFTLTPYEECHVCHRIPVMAGRAVANLWYNIVSLVGLNSLMVTIVSDVDI